MKCKFCKSRCIRKGYQKNSRQRYWCRSCNKYQQASYYYKACQGKTDRDIISHLKEGCGIRSTARLVGIHPNTVMSRIVRIASGVRGPGYVTKGKQYEMDELKTYIGNKRNRYWVAYSLRKDTREVVDFRVGKRTNKTLRPMACRIMPA